jgi:RNA-splicing ligase RtcB
MIILEGKYNTAKVFTNNIEESASTQIINLMNQEFVSGAKIRIMPDTHAGAGCVIGFTADLGNKVIPNLVGVDIGCGMYVVNFGKIFIDLNNLDNIIHNYVPVGHNIHETSFNEMSEINNLFCINELRNQNKFNRAIGTLGGGNHFIELNKDDDNNSYLVIHSGSRNLGKQVAEYYQNIAIESLKNLVDVNVLRNQAIAELKISGKASLIPQALKDIENRHKETQPVFPKELCFLENTNREYYLHDMAICQEYAAYNRETIADIILANILDTNSSEFDTFHTVHNYIDFDDNIIRKGAVSAYEREKLIIPINMRDGSILATGKGNGDWNFSAPHGAGRLMGRMEAKRRLSMGEFAETMNGIYSTTINESTLDEAPMAYKPMQEIIDNVQDTVTIDKIIKPVYNFKASE